MMRIPKTGKSTRPPIIDNDSGTGYRGEIFSRHLRHELGSSYFFNLKQNREGSIYLNIVESQRSRREYEGFKRHSILIFPEQRKGFVSNCLAALEALAEGQSCQKQFASPQRQFGFQVQAKRHGMFLCLSEDSLHYGKALQARLRVQQGCATAFSQALIEITEKWLEYEKAAGKILRRRPQSSAKPT